jgi:hypothetical protein
VSTQILPTAGDVGAVVCLYTSCNDPAVSVLSNFFHLYVPFVFSQITKSPVFNSHDHNKGPLVGVIAVVQIISNITHS